MSKTLINLSIILPTINESENLKKLIPEIVMELSDSNIDNYEILILDDGSTDDTVSFIEQFNKTNSNVIIKNRISEPSLPMAIFDGIDQSKYEHVMWLDADGSMPAKTIREMVNKQAKQFDAVIIGSRFIYWRVQLLGECKMRVPRAPATTNVLSQPTTCATTIALLSGTKHHRLNNSIQSLPRRYLLVGSSFSPGFCLRCT